jgi:uncharacterized protein YndB with AHSA1/START domain
MLKKVLLAIGGTLALAVIVVLGLAASRPDDFRVERKATLAAPPEKIFAVLNDFHRWREWSPWEKLDPGMRKTFGGAPSGPGATYAWSGNDDVGEGKMTLVSSTPNERVGIKLEFLKPFAATNDTTFLLAPTAAGTEVAWIMEGKNAFVSKIFGVLMDMDAMIGKDFEEGLSNLKQITGK